MKLSKEITAPQIIDDIMQLRSVNVNKEAHTEGIFDVLHIMSWMYILDNYE